MTYEADRRVVLAHQQMKEQVRSRVERYAVARWGALGSWRDADVDAFVAKVLPAIQTGQRTIAQMTNAYLDSLARLAGITPSPAYQVALANLRGVDAEEVYRRAGVSTWTALSENKPLNEAVRLGGQRLGQMISTDMQLAGTHTARGRMSGDNRVQGYRRVLSPGENCALCVMASTQRYHREDLLPIHSHCRCDVMPIFGTHDPGQVIAGDQLNELTSAIDEKFGKDGWDRNRPMRDIRVQMHGEHGPVLTWKGQEFTGPADF